MVRFNDKTLITTVASNDILPITDISDSSDDKKITVNLLSKYTVDNISTLSGGKVLTDVSLTSTMKNNYDIAYARSYVNAFRTPYIVAGSSHDKFIIKGGTYIKFSLGGVAKEYYLANDTEYTATSQLDTGSALTAGKDYYIYLVASGSTFVPKVSLNATYPSGYSATTAYLIGGFHTLCASVTADNAPALPDGSLWTSHPAIGYSAGDIIPNSVWCLTHRPIASPNGMVYVDLLDLWVDIYLQSGTGASTTSAFGATIRNSRTPIQHLWDLEMVGKRLARDAEFMVFAEGSNQKTNVYGSAQPNPFTAGGHVDTASKRMISGYFVEECCSLVWQWLDEIGFSGQTNWTSYGDEGTRGQTYGMPYILKAGGAWNDSSNCGSRSRFSYGTRSLVSAVSGGRGVSLPKLSV